MWSLSAGYEERNELPGRRGLPVSWTPCAFSWAFTGTCAGLGLNLWWIPCRIPYIPKPLLLSRTFLPFFCFPVFIFWKCLPLDYWEKCSCLIWAPPPPSALRVSRSVFSFSFAFKKFISIVMILHFSLLILCLLISFKFLPHLFTSSCSCIFSVSLPMEPSLKISRCVWVYQPTDFTLHPSPRPFQLLSSLSPTTARLTKGRTPAHHFGFITTCFFLCSLPSGCVSEIVLQLFCHCGCFPVFMWT